MDFLDTLKRSEGWKTILDTTGAWVQYNAVDFGRTKFSTLVARACSNSGGAIQVRLNGVTGPSVAELEVPAGTDWKDLTAPLSGMQPGINNLVVIQKGNARIEIDWMTFK